MGSSWIHFETILGSFWNIMGGVFLIKYVYILRKGENTTGYIHIFRVALDSKSASEGFKHGPKAEPHPMLHMFASMCRRGVHMSRAPRRSNVERTMTAHCIDTVLPNCSLTPRLNSLLPYPPLYHSQLCTINISHCGGPTIFKGQGSILVLSVLSWLRFGPGILFGRVWGHCWGRELFQGSCPKKQLGFSM